ncbi:hypothetical protein [uncultured Mucilaginibacter sp.]|uniref:hypothetical protein n=1 Tax=uncultured Mucilaginibacter sp. TaxID=797541 RepID=UPI0025ED9437|nr:hypothetical protein [uncultured Mucilaginibacter sp.]
MKKLLILSCLILMGQTVNARSSNFSINFNIQKKSNIVSAYIENSNVFVSYADKSIKQLTFNSSDSSPIILRNENAVLFVRNAGGDANNPKVKKIMKVNCGSLIETTITEKKPYQDGLAFTYYILGIQNLTLSLDEQQVYFTTECYATGNELVKVDLATGKWSKIFPADKFELIKRGSYKGLFLIGRNEIKGAGGRFTYYYLVNEKNEALKEFDSESSYNLFKNNFINN